VSIERNNKGKLNRSKHGVWHARIEITQLPAIPSDMDNSHTNESNAKYILSWLVNFFQDRTVYGLEVTLHRKEFRWIFFLRTDTEKEAYLKGTTFLMHLEDNYPGLTGTLSVAEYSSLEPPDKRQLYELRFPERYHQNSPDIKYNILRKIITLFHKNPGHKIQFYIIWQKIRRVLEPYDVKFFIKLVPNNSLISEKVEIYRLLGQLRYLTMHIKNTYGTRAEIVKISPSYWDLIMNLEVFSKNPQKKQRFYRENFDFYFLPELPLEKSKFLKDENISFSLDMGNTDQKILLGKYVKNSVVSENLKYLSKEDFTHSALIAGQPETGKTRFLGHLTKEFSMNAPEIGILIINTVKGKQEHLYHTNRIIKYGKEDFWVPYYVEGEYVDKSLQETADYIVASLGLKEPVNKIMLNVMKAYIKNKGDLPLSIAELFKGLRKWFQEHKYHKEYQTNILMAIENRVLSLLSDPLVEHTVNLSESEQIPRWFTEWENGKKIYLDLSSADLYIKRLISNAIFQLVRTLTPDQEAGELKKLIIIDEAHELLEAVKVNYNSLDEYISRSQLEEIFKHLLIEFRSKGLAFIIADQSPSSLFDCVVKMPSLKWIFRVGLQCASCFTNNLEEQDYIKTLKKRNLLFLNGINGEKYTLMTVDY